MLSDGLTKAVGPKIFKHFKRIIGMALADHFCRSGSVGEEGRTSWKVIEGIEGNGKS